MQKFIFYFLVCSFSLSVFSQDKERGKSLYTQCIQCHGEEGLGVEAEGGPKLAGQFDWYLISQLKAFRAEIRKNSKMFPFIAKLEDKDFSDLAAFITTMK